MKRTLMAIVLVVSATVVVFADGGGMGGGMGSGGMSGGSGMLVNHKSGFRANVGLVNVSPVPVTVAVEIFNADGQPAPGDSSFNVNLAPFDMTQMNDVLNKRLGTGERQGLIIRVGVVSAEGGVMAYLSQVDNTTNDGSYQEAFRFAFRSVLK